MALEWRSFSMAATPLTFADYTAIREEEGAYGTRTGRLRRVSRRALPLSSDKVPDRYPGGRSGGAILIGTLLVAENAPRKKKTKIIYPMSIRDDWRQLFQLIAIIWKFMSFS